MQLARPRRVRSSHDGLLETSSDVNLETRSVLGGCGKVFSSILGWWVAFEKSLTVATSLVVWVDGWPGPFLPWGVGGGEQTSNSVGQLLCPLQTLSRLSCLQYFALLWMQHFINYLKPTTMPIQWRQSLSDSEWELSAAKALPRHPQTCRLTLPWDDVSPGSNREVLQIDAALPEGETENCTRVTMTVRLQ